MRRVLAVLGTLLAFTLVASIVGTRAESASSYRVDAIFDTARGVIPGQLVKIAGARVGVIDDVTLTEDYKARVIMSVPRNFSFREDASCTIQPEGLISENFVQCDPGKPATGELKGDGDLPPTVPVERTTVPVSITDLFKIFQADVRQRFTVTLAAIGGGLASRGSDLNAIIRRANPTLAAVRKLTTDLARQKEQLSAAVRDTDRLVAELAERKGAVQDFIEQSERVTSQTADHSSALADAIRRLPPLLDRTDIAIDEVDRLLVNGRPLLGQLRAAAPGLNRAVDEIGPFVEAARPALKELSKTSGIAIKTLEDGAPVVDQLRQFAASALPTGQLLNDLLVDLRNRGFVEYLNLFAYYAAAAAARYDATSHVIPAHVIGTSCSQYAEKPVASCNAKYVDQSAPQAQQRSKRERPAAEKTPEPTATPKPAATPEPAKPDAKPKLPDVLDPVQGLTDQITENLADNLPKPLRDALKAPDKADQQTLQDLTDFLLGS